MSSRRSSRRRRLLRRRRVVVVRRGKHRRLRQPLSDELPDRQVRGHDRPGAPRQRAAGPPDPRRSPVVVPRRWSPRPLLGDVREVAPPPNSNRREKKRDDPVSEAASLASAARGLVRKGAAFAEEEEARGARDLSGLGRDGDQVPGPGAGDGVSGRLRRPQPRDAVDAALRRGGRRLRLAKDLFALPRPRRHAHPGLLARPPPRLSRRPRRPDDEE
mmetsp:Transcript_25869/g.83786  ORF Transcript_25869/g.83786 Transcript_25869/m.83786 type:complete len:216 (-) Transcript_25869:382-1029(-)